MIAPIAGLHIDVEFQRLIPPLTDEEYKALEQNLIRDGCRDPICVWENTILDGHNRYEICNRRGIRYSTIEIQLPNRDAAIAWICATQIGRRNITEEMRKYLIGKRYEAEKRLDLPNKNGANQYTKKTTSVLCTQPPVKIHRHKTAVRIGKDYNICPSSIQQYGNYAAAMDRIASSEKELALRMLSGEVKVSAAGTLQMAKMPISVFQATCNELSDRGIAGLQLSESREIISQHAMKPPKKPKPSVKDMPTYDPDVEVSSLALTIPSWRSSIDRVHNHENLKDISSIARDQLTNELHRLAKTIDDLLLAIKEKRK